MRFGGVEIGDWSETVIRVYLFDRRAGLGQWGGLELLTGLPAKSADHVIWVDAQNPSKEDHEFLFIHWLPVHTLSLEDITRPVRMPEQSPHLPKVEEFPDYLFVITNPVLGREVSEPGPLEVAQLSAVLTKSVLVTVHYGALPEQTLFHSRACVVLDQLLAWKRTIVSLRKTVLHEREVLYRLVRGEFSFIEQREVAYYRDVSDHLFRFAEMLETSREMVSDLLQNHLAHASHRLNEVMKVLTAVSTIILPMTLISGIYGMNFQEMPELHWSMGYPMALFLMTVAGSATYWFYRKRGWL